MRTSTFVKQMDRLLDPEVAKAEKRPKRTTGHQVPGRCGFFLFLLGGCLRRFGYQFGLTL